jgi:membrane-associated HD superfamily phosphohydrolase
MKNLINEAEDKVDLATKLHQTLGNECNYIRQQIEELQRRLAEKEKESSDAFYEVKQATKNLNRIVYEIYEKPTN